MHLYSGSTIEFISDSTRNTIASKLEQSFFDYFRYEPPRSEVRAWQNSLRAMASALELGAFNDHGIVVEYQLPLSSRRLDCLVTGTDAADRPGAVIIELKQWEETELSPIDECVTTFVGGAKRDVLHPSRQVGNYQRYLLDMNTAFSEGDVGLHACAYLHNLRSVESAPLRDERHEGLLAQWPLYAGDEVDSLVEYLDVNVGRGKGGPVLEHVLTGKYRPHKRLLDHAARIIRNEPAFVLLDEQQVVLNHVLTLTRARHLSTERSVFLIHGGPGTGKSLIAVNLLAELSAEGYVTFHATGSKAFTENLRRTVGNRAGALFKYFNGFMDADGEIDVLICDEAHRVREHSWNRYTKAEDRTDRLQVDELLAAAKVCVFFLDDLQVVRPAEVGSSSLIRERGAAHGIPVIEHTLEAQFRCGGSDGFVQWVENTLGLRRTPFVLWDPAEEFDFEIIDTPEELEALIRARDAEGHTARLSAGFCWPWSKPNADGTLVHDVRVEGWSMPWNAKSDASRLAPGIPKSDYWASDPGGVDQVGCIYTAQGFEYDYAGIIFGRDLVYRHGQGWVGQPEHSHDSVVKRAARLGTGAGFTELVKHTYRVLLTRGLRGCAVYFQDDETKHFFLSRIET
ncbi:MAG: DUF2075 domain-containing protein [Acidimicrobiia bacterium]|nr:DUF2075 domain-containing protein [Acidimicrobiia bacterium]